MMLSTNPGSGLGNGGVISSRTQNGGGGGRHRRLLLLFLAAVLAGCALSGLPLLLRSSSSTAASSSLYLSDRLRHSRLDRWLPTAKAQAAPAAAPSSVASAAAAETGSSGGNGAAAAGAAAPLQGMSAASEGATGGAAGGPDARARGTRQQQPEAAAAVVQAQSLIPSYGWARWRWKWEPADGVSTEPTAQQQQLGQQGANATAGGSSAGGVPPDVDLPSQLVIKLSQHEQQPLRATTAADAPIPQLLTTAAVQEPDDLQRLLGQRPDSSSSSSSASEQLPVNGTAAAAEVWPPGVIDPADATSPYIQARGVPPVHVKYPLWWHGPIWAGSGYGSGAVASLGEGSRVL
jgi:hypothetical protein